MTFLNVLVFFFFMIEFYSYIVPDKAMAISQLYQLLMVAFMKRHFFKLESEGIGNEIAIINCASTSSSS